MFNLGVSSLKENKRIKYAHINKLGKIKNTDVGNSKTIFI